jgi:tripartite ATP-independent transporter DctM subunit
LFKECFGWLPGGIAAATVLVCAFFTTFTGASGVTILALGGLLLPVLLKAGYKEQFAIGLLIASGSIGLLFPPSLPVILYGVVAQVPIDKMFVAGALPGLLLVSLLIGMGVWHSFRHGVVRSKFDGPAAIKALLAAKWEAAMPVLVLVGIFGGFLTIFEAAAFTAAYAFLTEVVIHRDLSLKTDVPRVLVECGSLMGGVLIILGVSLGFTNFLIDSEIPQLATEWAKSEIGTKVVFILMLNVFLLMVGCLMDIFSAIVVVVPLIVPIAQLFGMDPIHLGILFLANLELGYLTPPVGMNLFLGAYRFDKPVTTMYRVALPFLCMLAIGVLVIAYVPKLTTWAHDEGDMMPIDFERDLMESGPLDSGTGTGLPGLPLGNFDFEALLNADDDDSAKADPAPEPDPDDATP